MTYLFFAIFLGLVVALILASRDCLEAEFKQYEIEQILKNIDKEQAEACKRS